MPPSPESPYRLLVEGEDDKHSIIHLLARHSFDWHDEGTIRPYVSSEGSVERLLRALPVAVKSAHSRIGVVLDADLDLPIRWLQVRNRLESAGLKVPERPSAEGTILPGLRAGTRIGIWLMPDNSSPGILEDFLGNLVPPEDPIWSYADEVASEARHRGARCRETLRGLVSPSLHGFSVACAAESLTPEESIKTKSRNRRVETRLIKFRACRGPLPEKLPLCASWPQVAAAS
jgi:hypothetical protein